MVIFYTQAYNAEKTLPRTIQSVLGQTETDWVWYLLDNGSQDGTGEMIRVNAAKDERICPLRNEQNNHFTRETSNLWLPKRHDDADWFCILDADDTYTPDFLTKMLAFVEQHQLDMAACGSDFIDADTGDMIRRRMLQGDLIVDSPEGFDEYYPVYHEFIRTNWAKLFSIRLAKQLDYRRIPASYYGGDTLFSQEMLRQAKRFGILAKPLHHYYVSRKSRSYQWHPHRMDSDLILYNTAVNFLVDKCGYVSPQNQTFMYVVYCNAVNDTTKCIYNSALLPAEKLRECRKIAENPITQEAHRANIEEADASRTGLVVCSLFAGAELKEEDDSDLRILFQLLLPRTGQIISKENAEMFLKNEQLVLALLRDEPEPVLVILLNFLENNQGVKKYRIPKAIQALAVNKPLLCQIQDGVFLRKYGKLYMAIWRGEYLSVLEEMTGLLLGNQVSGGMEAFLKLYISLAAVTEQVPAFIYGKIQLAQFYLRQNRLSECKSELSDLEEMGLSDDEELINLRQLLNEQDGERSSMT